MKRIAPLLMLAFVVGLLRSESASGQDVPAAQEIGKRKELSGRAADFAVDLYKKLSEKEGNLFLSPFSITAALGMAYAGARGETAEEMRKALHFAQNNPEFHQLLGSWIQSLSGKTQEKSGFEMVIANRLWGQKGFPFLKEFLSLTQDRYGAGLEGVDFEGAAEEARKTINDWVERQTKEKIKDLLQPGVLDELTRLVLTNAIYFKGEWKVQFDKSATKDGDFFVSADRKVTVPLMVHQGEYSYGETPEAQVLELPYKGDEVSMVLFLPKEKDGLGKLEKGLDRKLLETVLDPNRDVLVHLPRFTMTCDFLLNDVLKSMGMISAFSGDEADFSGMNEIRSGLDRLFISHVVHKAFANVNEEGTEAAAATAIILKWRGMPPQAPAVFRADHPFLFAIRDNQTGAILFMGRVVNPA